VKNIATQGFYSRAFVKSDKWWDEKVGIYVFKNISSYVSSFIGERCFFFPKCNVSSKSRATNENFSIQAKRFKGNLPFVRKHLSK
jgi:hypothetical protein